MAYGEGSTAAVAGGELQAAQGADLGAGAERLGGRPASRVARAVAPAARDDVERTRWEALVALPRSLVRCGREAGAGVKVNVQNSGPVGADSV